MADVAALSIKIDSTQVKSATDDLKNLVGESDKTERSTKKLETSATSLDKSMGVLSKSIDSLLSAMGKPTIDQTEKSVRNLSAATKEVKPIQSIVDTEMQGQVNSMVANLSRLNRLSSMNSSDGGWMATVGKNAAELAHSLNLPTSVIENLQNRMLQTQSAKAQVDALKALGAQAGLTAAEMRALGTQMGLSGTALEQINEKAQGGGNGFFGGGMLGSISMMTAKFMLLRQAIQMIVDPMLAVSAAVMKFESLDVSFTAITGSADLGAKQLEHISEVSDKLGLNFLKTADAYKRFIAAGSGGMLSMQQLSDIFDKVMRASVTLGASADDQMHILLALEQMLSKGKVSMEELRRQLGNSLPRAVRIMAEALGVTTGQMEQMVAKGQVLADEILPKFADRLDKAFGSGAEAAAKTGAAGVNRLENAWERFKASLMDTTSLSHVLGLLTAVINGATWVANHVLGEKTDTSLRTIADLSTRIKELEEKRSRWQGIGAPEEKELTIRINALKQALAVEVQRLNTAKQQAIEDAKQAKINKQSDLDAAAQKEYDKQHKKDLAAAAKAKRAADAIAERQRSALSELKGELGKATDTGDEGTGKIAALQHKYEEFAHRLRGKVTPELIAYKKAIDDAALHDGFLASERAKANRSIDEQIGLIKDEIAVRSATQNLYGKDYTETVAMLQAKTAADRAYIKAKHEGADKEYRDQLRSLTIQNEQLKLDEQREQSAKTLAAGFAGPAYDAAVRQTEAEYDLAKKRYTTDAASLELAKKVKLAQMESNRLNVSGIASSFAGPAYDAAVAQTEAEYRLAKKSVTDTLSLERAKNSKLAEMEAARLRNTENSYDGMKSGLISYTESLGTAASRSADMWSNSMKTMEDALTDFVANGKTDIESLFKAIRTEYIKTQVVQPFMKSISSGSLWSSITNLFSANGNVLSGPGISALSGGVYSQPTAFGYNQHITGFANGGVLGEAGPEAVMPLARTSSGKLGVRTTDDGKSGGTQTVTVIMKDSKGNQTAAPMDFNTNGMRNFILNVVRDASERGVAGFQRA